MRSQATARKAITMLENEMSQEQIAEGRKLAGNFKPREAEKLSDQEKETFKTNMEKVEKIPMRPTATNTPAATVPTQDMSPGNTVLKSMETTATLFRYRQTICSTSGAAPDRTTAL